MTDHKDAAAVRIMPPLIPLIAILLSVVLNRVWPITLGIAPITPGRYWIGGGLIVGAVFVLGLWPVMLFRRAGQNPIPWTPTPQIERRGPFRFTRNPMYLQMIVTCVGLAIIMVNWWLILFTPLVGWLLQHHVILPEEAYLAQKFGPEYLDYQRRVRRWL